MAFHRLAVATLTALAVAAGVAAQARADEQSSGGADKERMTAWASKLGLSDQQRDQLHRVCSEFEARLDPLEEQLWKLHHEEFDAVKGVLTQEQRDKLPAAIKTEIGNEVKSIGDRLGLSEAQRQKAEQIVETYEPKFREVCTQASDDARKKMRQLRSEFFGEIRQVLSEDQREKFAGVLREDFRRWRDPVTRHERMQEFTNQLGLSADQKSQVQKIHSEYQPKVEQVVRQLKDACHEERAAMSKVLTDEQRTKAHQMWQALGETSDQKNR